MSEIHHIDYHKERMANREVETILAELAQERAETVYETMETFREVRQNKQHRHHQINKNIAETHVDQLSLGINTFMATAQILGAFLTPQSPLAGFINALSQGGNATTKYVEGEKSSHLATLNHVYQDLGGLAQEGREDIRQKMDQFRQSMQDKFQALHSIDRLVQTLFSGSSA